MLQAAVTRSWTSEKERDSILSQLKESNPHPTQIIPLVWSKDPAARKLGVELFLERPNASAVSTLINQMVDQPRHVRSFALRIFGRIDDNILEKAINNLLKDRAQEKQRLGWELALNLSGPLLEKFLIRAIKEAPDIMKVSALQRLVRDTDPKSILTILIDAAKAKDPRLAAVALEALSKVADTSVIELMLDRFARGDAAARELAAKNLRQSAKQNPDMMRKYMLELLGEGEDATRRLTVEILFETGKTEEVLLDILNYSKNLIGWLRDRILETLRTMGEQVLGPALKLLEHEVEEIRTSALILAEAFDDPRIIGPVCKLLQDEDWWLRITACDTLGRLAKAEAVPALVNALKDENTRWAAIDALARIGSPNSLKSLAALVRDKRQEVRMEVVKAFGAFSDKRLIPLLKVVVEKDPSSEVKTRAIEVLRDLTEKLGGEAIDMEQGTTAISSKKLNNPLDQLLAQVREDGASDLHITVGEPPITRETGILTRMEGVPLTADQTREAIMSILLQKSKDILEKDGQVDFCHSIPEVGRYRANVFEQSRGLCGAFRVIPNIPPTFADLRIPGKLTELLDYHQGIIVVSGPAASGKSTTLAAIINLINETKPDHIITLEDPIEFVHPAKTALVNQREIGLHSQSFSRSIRAALREDPDVVMVGEMRDTETVRMALMAAETGHLVVATLHTTSAVQTIDRLVGSFPPEEQPQIRVALSESLKYVLCQSLVPRKDGKGRVAVFEVLKNSLSIGNLIRENKTFQIPSLMQIGRNMGMQTVDMALMELVESGLIAPEEAWKKAEKPETFAPLCDPSFIEEAESIE